MPHRKACVFIDFDKTISPVHGFHEEPTEQVISSIKILHEKYRIVIYSCRANLEVCDYSDYLMMIKYLNNYRIPYDEVRRDKPLFAAIIDDRSFNPITQSWDSIVNNLMGVV